jgi:hypothetical protein
MDDEMRISKYAFKLLNLFPLLLLIACQGAKIENDDADLLNKNQKRDQHLGKLLGNDSISFGNSSRQKLDDPGSAIGVNTYLWRASLDTISFMPLKSVDPFGGVILTDWYTPSKTPNERIKVDIRILDRQLRVDGLKISVFRQKYDGSRWMDIPVNPSTARKLEDTILTRAREMKVNSGR